MLFVRRLRPLRMRLFVRRLLVVGSGFVRIRIRGIRRFFSCRLGDRAPVVEIGVIVGLRRRVL
jgi:hypothetical protein